MREPAERAAQAARAEAVVQLAWLAPDAASLAALARPPSHTTWASIRHDPGAVLLVLRHDAGASLASPATLSNPDILTTARTLLDQRGPGFVDWNELPARCVYRMALAAARAARRLAEQTGLGDPERAWVCGLLAPLGAMALCAVGASQAAVDWAAETAELTRLLARRWGLPDWLTGVIGHCTLPRPLAERLGAAPLYYRFLHLALERARRQGFDLGLACPEKAAEAAQALGVAALDEASTGEMPAAWRDPAREPLLGDLLAVAGENRRLRATPLHRILEEDNVALHRALQEQVCGEAERLQAAKLAALAEFAAGAGHEINNPLAVISGQTQYLLSHGEEWFAEEPDDTSRKALQSILTQTWRIHGVLRDLMQFARPLAPRPVTFDLGPLMHEVAAAHQESARARQVRLDVTATDRPACVHADPEQVRLALACLVRNAVEAASVEGWARLRLVVPGEDGRVEVVVEDSGPGPDAAQHAHLFDPFYSGRSAGRGRGLGLPTAWRLARLQGGSVRLEPPRPGQPTRAVLSLPALAPTDTHALRTCA